MNALLDAQVKVAIGDFQLDVSLKLGREIGVLFGPSGSGKSVTLRCLAGLRKVPSGRITLSGRVLLDSPSGVCEPPHRRKMGLLFQDLALFPHMTALENVLFGCGRRERGKRCPSRGIGSPGCAWDPWKTGTPPSSRGDRGKGWPWREP